MGIKINNKLNSIAIIPARGGSKRLPRKNILDLDGIPLLTRVIKTAKSSKVFDEIIVSSEDQKILNIAKDAGAKVHIRPLNLASDTSTVVETCLDVLKENLTNIFCCIYATAVLIKKETLQKSYKKFLLDKNSDVLMCVSEYNFHPVKALNILEDGRARFLFPNHQNLQSNNFPKTRVSNGTFYWAKYETFINEKSFYSKNLKTFDISESEVCDIDTPDDFIKLRKYYFQNLKRN